MESAFGVEHGDISKGLPSAVKAGGGGVRGGWLRAKNQQGKYGAQQPLIRDITTKTGRQIKEGLKHDDIVHNARQGNSRRIRAELLNADSAARRKGWKTGKTSALSRHYRGRVDTPMKPLP